MESKIPSIKKLPMIVLLRILFSFFLISVSYYLIYYVLTTKQIVSTPSTAGTVIENLDLTWQESDQRSFLQKSGLDFAFFDKTGKMYFSHGIDQNVHILIENTPMVENIEVGADFHLMPLTDGNFLLVRIPKEVEFSNHKLRQSFSAKYLGWFCLFFLFSISIVINLLRIFMDLKRDLERLRDQIEEDKIDSQLSFSVKETNELYTHQINSNCKLEQLIEKQKLQKENLAFQVASLTHDLKTPLTIILANIEMIELINDNQQISDKINDIQEASLKLDKYFNQLIEYSVLDIKTLDFEVVNIQDFVNRLVEQINLIANDVVVHIDQDIKFGSIVKLQEDNLMRTILNVVSNSLEYANPLNKTIWVSFSTDQDLFYIMIKDNGPGFTKKALEQAHKLFFTDDDQTRRHYGLGLAFAQKIINLHHGNLNLSNAENQGAIVRIELPLSKIRR